MAIKIAHEAPKSIFEDIETWTSYSYALVHLFEEDEEYYNHFKNAVNRGREVILDNSIFELEEAFEADKFHHWINKLKPEWYIIPDSLEDSKETILLMEKWNKLYRKSSHGKAIGVVQGRTYREIVECYQYLDEIADVDMIAISFDYSYYTESFPHPNKYYSWMMGRVKLLGDLLRDGVINESKPHHLLGVALPNEGKFYRDYNWIYSVDTSNPVVHGYKGIRYERNAGLKTKESQKLFTMINAEVSKEQLKDINYNIGEFYKYWNRD